MTVTDGNLASVTCRRGALGRFGKALKPGLDCLHSAPCGDYRVVAGWATTAAAPTWWLSSTVRTSTGHASFERQPQRQLGRSRAWPESPVLARYCQHVRPSSRSATIGPHSVMKRRFVQRESTATGADLTGLERTPWDGDLHRCTAVDVLPADGMQEARGSSPLSSTRSQI